MSGQSNRYRYSPLLEPNSIRLLSIQPGEPGEDLCCDLFQASLDDPPAPYEALSYAWGNIAKPCNIICGPSKQQIAITLTCEAAIRRLRRRQEARVVWIDALCIYSYRTVMKPLENLRF